MGAKIHPRNMGAKTQQPPAERPQSRPEGDRCLTKEYATHLLRQCTEVPKDFQAIFVARADPNIVQNARKTLELERKMVALSLVIFPFAVPLYMLQKDMKSMSKKLTSGAEDDVYVVGNKGYATLNNGHLKAWTPRGSMVFEPDSELFKSDSAKVKQQTVLALSELRTGQFYQLWFVDPRLERFLELLSKQK